MCGVECRLGEIRSVADIRAAVLDELLTPYELPDVPNLITFLDGYSAKRLSTSQADLSVLEEMAQLVSWQGFGINIDDPVTTVWRVSGRLTEASLIGVDEYRRFAEIGDVDVFVVVVSQASGIGFSVSSPGGDVVADPTATQEVWRLSSSNSMDAAFFIADQGPRVDLVENPPGERLFPATVFTASMRSSAG